MLWGDKLCKAVEGIAGFRPFESQDGEVLFAFMEDTAVPVMENVEYTFGYEDVRGFFGRTVKGFMLKLEPSGGNALYLWCTDGGNEVWICGNLSARLYRFALWVGYGLMTLPYGTIAVHSSCIVYRDRAVLFLGESGTGKSTHTRLWREHVEGAFLLNDDSPVLRVEDDVVRVYGSPWSGKTPCYRQECSARKVWWICVQGHEWRAIISNRTKHGQGCPYCRLTGQYTLPARRNLLMTTVCMTM